MSSHAASTAANCSTASIDTTSIQANARHGRRVTGFAVGACTHDPFSATGIIATSQGLANGGNWEIRRSDLHP